MDSLSKSLAGAHSWSDVYDRLSNLNSTNPKAAGTLFEHFAHRFFSTDPESRAKFKDVWLLESVPIEIRNRLDIGKKDFGIDLVLRSFRDEIFAVQCKFRNDQSSTLSWTKDSLSSWLSGSLRADGRILFTNASGIDSETRRVAERKEEGKKFRLYSIGDLLEITEEVLRAIVHHSQHPTIAFRKKEPKPHQIEAIESVLSGFGRSDRGQLILPCGAGKTLTALWIREKLRAELVLVLVPSLTLLKQIKDEWLVNEQKHLGYLCVCSDASVDESRELDLPEISSFEVDEFVTTSPAAVCDFIKFNSRGTIYSTYQSLAVIAEATRDIDVQFDLVIADEAHRTAGSLRDAFGLIHDATKIRSRRRLYMTATPRIVSPQVKGKLNEESLQYLADMSDERIFGPEFFRMTFKDAIECGILVDYKILAIGVTDTETKQKLKERRLVDRDLSLDEVANNIALAKTFQNYGVSHALTFHSRVSSARDFVSRQLQLFPEVKFADYVSGAQPTNARKQKLDQFAKSELGILSNARCLTEGIDVPNIDCVYFCDPRNSVVDIVQATGRALRKPVLGAKKDLGYIVVPIYHESSEDIEEAIGTSVFENLVSVIRAMAANDKRLADEIKEIRLDKGRRRKVPSRIVVDLNNRVDLTEPYSKEHLYTTIFHEVISKVSVEWREYLKAKEFVHSLKIKNHIDWIAWAKTQQCPIDIPSDPVKIYKSRGWESWGAWLGTGTVAPRLKQFRPFLEAREFARSLKLYSKTEWEKFRSGEILEKGRLPKDIPSAPDGAYADDGWVNWGDWLGTDQIAPRLRKYRPFAEAREFAVTLQLSRREEWNEYAAGKLSGYPTLPTNIPKTPNNTYKNKGWLGWGHWLGSGRNKPNRMGYETPDIMEEFHEARTFARQLELGTRDEWIKYCNGEINDKPKLPSNIPKYPNQVFADSGWVGWSDWLGSSRRVSKNRWSLEPGSEASADEAKRFVRSLGLKNASQWRDYYDGKIPSKPERPPNIPFSLAHVYNNKGWTNWGDWLGTGKISNRKRAFLPFEEARKFVRSLKLKNQGEWKAYCLGELPENGTCPSNIPRNPYQAYKGKGWINEGDWLGTFSVAPKNRKYRKFQHARKFAQSLNLRNQVEWRRYCNGDFLERPSLPSDIPVSPGQVYKNVGWSGFGDWLGTGRIADQHRVFRDFHEARKFARNLELISESEWRQYCKGLLKNKPRLPSDISASPAKTYKDKGWMGFGDWLGTGRIADQLKVYRPFLGARKFARSLDLRSEKEWREYCKGRIKGKPPRPSDVSASPWKTYKGKGWVGIGDWLGTGTIAPNRREYLPFDAARKFARSLKLRSGSEWRRYCQGKIKNKPKLPTEIPASPAKTYKNVGWTSMGDWLGTGRIADRLRVYRPFLEAREFVRTLNLQSGTEWKKYCKGEIRNKPRLPSDIPAYPNQTYYQKGWSGMKDWLGKNEKP